MSNENLDNPSTPMMDVVALNATFRRFFGTSNAVGPADFAYFEELISDFGDELDVNEEMKRFQAWTLDHGYSTVPNPHHRFRSWLHRARQYGTRSRT